MFRPNNRRQIHQVAVLVSVDELHKRSSFRAFKKYKCLGKVLR